MSQDHAPIAIINEILAICGLPITVAIHENDRILAKKPDSEEYSIAELSDGERNALLIAAAVLTATPGSLILVDEPERHLHRSIISPLLTHLFARRGDCAFIVSTHEVLLPLDHPGALSLLVRHCVYGKKGVGWEIDVVDGRDGIPEELKLDIYGSRRKVLFVEGTEESLDKPLYGILFPEVTVVPKGDCREVERATVGVRDASDLHWAEAYGLVDEDGREEGDRERFEGKGVYAIACYSVESLYYHPEMLDVISKRAASLHGSDPGERQSRAIAAAIKAVQEHRQRLCARVVARKTRESVLGQVPSPGQVVGGEDVSITIPVSTYLQRELSFFDRAVTYCDYIKLIQRYPLRETPALTQVAAQMGFRTRREYEAAVLKACSDDDKVRALVLGWLGKLGAVLNDSGHAEPERIGGEVPSPDGDPPGCET